MKAMIIDDEPLARRELRWLLREHPWIEIVGEAGHVEDAAQKIAQATPQLLFLDVQMPGGSGFDLLSRLEYLPHVIFTTAHDQHAVQAFDVNALDYLLKPVDPARLEESLKRIRLSTDTAAPSKLQPLERLFVRDGQRCWFVPLSEVRLLAAEGNFVRLQWGKLQPMLGRPLAALERRLDPTHFFRANRSQIINLQFVEAVEIGNNGLLHVQLRDGGPEIEISRRQARLFRAMNSV
jgi:two-component system, LytTR family, response regulator